MNEEKNDTQLRSLLIFISGMGVLGLLLALLLFGGDLLGGGSAVEETAGSVSIEEALTRTVEETDGSPISVGTTAPNFTLIDLEGNPHSLADLRGRPVIVNFWATWCAPCRIEMPELQQTFENYAGDDLAILAVNREETPEQVSDFFIEDLGLTFTPLLDSEAAVADAYGVFNMPTTFFVNGDGIVTAVHRGPMTLEVIDGYLAETIQ